MTAPSITQIKPGILNALRKATQIGINFNPRTIILTPYLKQKAASGGAVTWVAQSPRPPQVFTIEPVASTLQGITSTTGGNVTAEQGTASAREWFYYITGTWNSEMDVNDRWIDGDMTYTIVSLQPFNGYEKVGVVRSYGSDPNYGS